MLHHTDIESRHLEGADLRAETEYMRAIEHLHLSRGWLALGYHFVVMPSGRIFQGRPLRVLGAHVRGHNRGTVGVSLAGDFNVEQPTARAVEAITYLRRHLIPRGQEVPLVGHRDLADTPCPGRFLYPYVVQDGAVARSAPGESTLPSAVGYLEEKRTVALVSSSR